MATFDLREASHTRTPGAASGKGKTSPAQIVATHLLLSRTKPAATTTTTTEAGEAR